MYQPYPDDDHKERWNLKLSYRPIVVNYAYRSSQVIYWSEKKQSFLSAFISD